MRRLRALAARLAPALLANAAFVCVLGFLVGESGAELESSVFTSRADRLRMVVPRGWRATDQPSYPSLLLWMARTQPPGQIVLTAEPFTRELYCDWPATCRSSTDAPIAKYACALRSKLERQRLRVGPAQPGPKENELAGLPSMWFEYDDGKRFLRQAVALSSDRAVSLVLAAPTNDARAAHVRQFDQTLRTLRVLTAAEATPTTAPDAGGLVTIDSGVVDAVAVPADATLDAGIVLEAPPTPKLAAIGSCPGDRTVAPPAPPASAPR